MVSWLQKIPSGNESRAEGENDEMTVQNYRYRDWKRTLTSEVFWKPHHYLAINKYTANESDELGKKNS